MISTIDATHDPDLSSWAPGADDPGTDFPIQNLPFGRFRRAGEDRWRAGVAIGTGVLDLDATGLVDGPEVTRILSLSAPARRELRRRLSAGLTTGSGAERSWRGALVAQNDVELGLPCDIGDYTDFYTGIHHATAVGRLMRPDNPLLPNYKWIPIGYHGRSSSVIASGGAFHRPLGQVKPAGVDLPALAPTARLDYELELGIVIGQGNELGRPVPIDEAEDHVAGLTLLNDWSARDIQGWEYQPLGPFLAKNFATTLSPWIVTLEALAPFRFPFTRPDGDPAPLAYLDSPVNRRAGVVGIDLEVQLDTAAMRSAGVGSACLSRSNYRDAYWTIAQLVAHHTINGCNLRSGDLLGTGTISGPLPEQAGSLLELTEGGRKAIELPGGETRRFLENGDRVTLKASCHRDGFRRIGFGTCEGVVLPAPRMPT